MADENAEDADGDAEGGKKGGKKKLIFILLAVVVLAGVGGAAAFFLGVFDPPPEEGEEMAEEEVEPAGECGAAFLTLDKLQVNLNSSGRNTTFLTVEVAIEMRTEADMAALESKKPAIMDAFQVFLRELRIDDLRGSAGAERLRQEMLFRVSQIADPIPVCTIRFQNLIFQ